MLRKKLLIVVIFIIAFSLLTFSSATGQTKKKPAGDAGAKLFEEHCATCHDGGLNTIEADKTLMLDALKKNGFNGVDDIKARVLEGKGIMPSFKDELKADEVTAVSTYVWAQAQKNWKK